MLEIKAIETDDLQALADLYYDLTGIHSNLPIMQDKFHKMQIDSDYLLLGAKLDNILVGSLMAIFCMDLVGDCKDFILVENVIVHKEYRKKGIGRSLMAYIEKLAFERQVYFIQFVSSAHRVDAHHFYESIGYRMEDARGFRKYIAG